MNTWNDIERRLKTEGGQEAPPELHHQIMRAVRDDRAMATALVARRHAGSWLLAGAAVAALLVATVVSQRTGVHGTAAGGVAMAGFSAPSFSLAGLEAMATAPVGDEVRSLQQDLRSAMDFLADCLPDGTTDT